PIRGLGHESKEPVDERLPPTGLLHLFGPTGHPHIVPFLKERGQVNSFPSLASVRRRVSERAPARHRGQRWRRPPGGHGVDAGVERRIISSTAPPPLVRTSLAPSLCQSGDTGVQVRTASHS